VEEVKGDDWEFFRNVVVIKMGIKKRRVIEELSGIYKILSFHRR
jgi:hypothetical protein